MASPVVTQFKLETTQYESKLRDATQGLREMLRMTNVAGGDFKSLSQKTKDMAASFGNIEVGAKNAKDKVRELTQAFNAVAGQYNILTKELKESDVGRSIAGQLEVLRGRISEAKRELYDTNRELNGSKFGEFGSIIDDVGHKMGISANLTKLLTSKTALMSAGIAASAAIVGKAASQWAEYNKELSRQTQVTTVTTGLTGGGADKMTDQARAVADTYGVDFREVINAANTLMTQFGQTGSQSMQLIRDGMQGMIQGDGPKLLSMIQQYAPSFRDAGISASQLVAIIHNSEGGIFTDQNMNAIVMGIKNIRLMTNQTSEALGKLGIDGQKMSQQLSDGSMTVFQAIGQVSAAIERTGSGSKAAGEVMQYVFGRQGTAAGTKLGEAIATLNTNLEETKRQTGELGEAFADLQTANERLNTAIREAFGYDGWQAMAAGIKSDLLTALSVVIERLGNIRRMMFGFNRSDASTELAKQGMDAETKLQELQGKKQGSFGQQFNYNSTVREYTKAIDEAQRQLDKLGNTTVISPTTGMAYDPFAKQRNALEATLEALREEKNAYERQAQLILNGTGGQGNGQQPPPSPTTKPTAKEQTELQKNQQLISDLTQEYQVLADKAKTASGQELVAADDRMTAIQGEIRVLQERNEELKRWADLAQGKTSQNIDVTHIAAPDPSKMGVKALPLFDFDASKSTGVSQKSVDGLVSQFQQAVQTADIGGALMQNLQAGLADATTLSTLLKTAIENGLNTEGMDFAGLREQIGRGLDIPDEKFQELQAKINEQLQAMGLDPINIDFKTGKNVVKTANDTNKAWQAAAQAISNAGSALLNMENPAAKVAGIVMQAIANIALGFAQASASKATGVAGVFGWIAAVTAGLATMTATIASIKNATKGGFAEGGIVPGNSYSGDNLRTSDYGINSGELVLTRAQTNSIAAQLSDGDGRGQGRTSSSVQISSETLRIVLHNGARARGMSVGEYLNI